MTDKSHVALQHAWEQRYNFETLVNTPSFRLRRIYVDGPYLFAFSKAWKGQVPEEREDTEDLHVLDKYSGRLLLTIPGNRAHAAHAVGAGYVLTSSNAQGKLGEGIAAHRSLRGLPRRGDAERSARPDRRCDYLPHARSARTSRRAGSAAQPPAAGGIPRQLSSRVRGKHRRAS